MPGPFLPLFVQALTPKGTTSWHCNRVWIMKEYCFHEEKSKRAEDWAEWDEFVVKGGGDILINLG